MARWIAIGLLVLPAAEIAAFVLVAAEIGILAALALVLGLSLFGLILLRRHGRAEIARLRRAMAEPRGGETFADAVPVLAGILLLVPGFITAAAGLMLLLWRPRLGATIRREAGDGRRHDGPAVVDLAPEEWRRHDSSPGGREGREK